MKPSMLQTILVGLAVLGCMVVITLLTLMSISLLSSSSEPEEAGRICVFTEIEVWCIYTKEVGNGS